MVSIVFPLVIAIGVTLAISLFGKNKSSVSKIFLSIFVALGILPLVKYETGESIIIPIVAAGYVGVAFSYFYYKYSSPKLFLDYISPAILVFPALFVFSPNIFVLAAPEDNRKNYPVVSIPSDTPVIFILFDEFPLSSILNEDLLVDGQAFPNFRRFADKAKWFRNASANFDFTGYALKGMLTGLDQYDKKVGTYKHFPNNLFTLLGNEYRVFAHESALRLCPPHICLNEEGKSVGEIVMFWKDIAAVYLNLILPQPKSFGVPDINHRYKDFWNQNDKKDGKPRKRKKIVRKEFTIPMVEEGFRERMMTGREGIFNEFLDKFDSVGKKEFHFLHILLPHMPYRFLPSGKMYDLAGEFDYVGLNRENTEREIWGTESWINKVQYQRLISQVGFTDSLLGKLIDRLEEKNIFNSALIVLAADHGVSIKEGGYRRRVEGQFLPDIASIPLLIKLPGQEKGEVSDFPATLWDILPTLAEVLNIKVPWKINGNSLLNPSPEKRERIIHDFELKTYPVPDDLRPYLLDDVNRKKKLFGQFKGWDKFRLQNEMSNSFMDRLVTEFKVQVLEDIQVKLNSGLRVEKNEEIVPTMVHGLISGVENGGEWMALVASNGVFRAVSQVVKNEGQHEIFTLLPEQAFKEGENVIEVYLIKLPVENASKIFQPRKF